MSMYEHVYVHMYEHVYVDMYHNWAASIFVLSTAIEIRIASCTIIIL